MLDLPPERDLPDPHGMLQSILDSAPAPQGVLDSMFEADSTTTARRPWLVMGAAAATVTVASGLLAVAVPGSLIPDWSDSKNQPVSSKVASPNPSQGHSTGKSAPAGAGGSSAFSAASASTTPSPTPQATTPTPTESASPGSASMTSEPTADRPAQPNDRSDDRTRANSNPTQQNQGNRVSGEQAPTREQAPTHRSTANGRTVAPDTATSTAKSKPAKPAKPPESEKPRSSSGEKNPSNGGQGNGAQGRGQVLTVPPGQAKKVTP